MKHNILFALTAVAGLALSCANAADTYKIDPMHTSLGFSVRHMGISNVKGHFDEFAGSLVFDNGELKEASGTIQVKSINTGVTARDNHLRKPDFFDAANHPVITFKGKRVEKTGGQTVLVADFTMRGVTKELRLPVTVSGPIKDPQGTSRVGLEGTAKVNRNEYGIGTGAGASLIGEEVTLEINAEATMQK